MFRRAYEIKEREVKWDLDTESAMIEAIDLALGEARKYCQEYGALRDAASGSPPVSSPPLDSFSTERPKVKRQQKSLRSLVLRRSMERQWHQEGQRDTTGSQSHKDPDV
jgi:hypothetical protein